jgi:hypothetical protein
MRQQALESTTCLPAGATRAMPHRAGRGRVWLAQLAPIHGVSKRSIAALSRELSTRSTSYCVAAAPREEAEKQMHNAARPGLAKLVSIALYAAMRNRQPSA